MPLQKPNRPAWRASRATGCTGKTAPFSVLDMGFPCRAVLVLARGRRADPFPVHVSRLGSDVLTSDFICVMAVLLSWISRSLWVNS